MLKKIGGIQTVIGLAILAGLIALIAKDRKEGEGTAGNGAGASPGLPESGAKGLDMNKALFEGVNGPEVQQLQRWLNRDGATPKLSTDGKFGPLTAAALTKKKNVALVTLNQYNWI